MGTYEHVYIPHLFYPFVFDGHLGCFHVIAIVNNAAVNIGVHISFQISGLGFCSNIYSAV